MVAGGMLTWIVKVADAAPAVTCSVIVDSPLLVTYPFAEAFPVSPVAVITSESVIEPEITFQVNRRMVRKIKLAVDEQMRDRGRGLAFENRRAV